MKRKNLKRKSANNYPRRRKNKRKPLKGSNETQNREFPRLGGFPRLVIFPGYEEYPGGIFPGSPVRFFSPVPQLQRPGYVPGY